MSSIIQLTLRSTPRWTCSACARGMTVSGARWSSTETAPPALLSKMKGDLKSAMKNKDKARLNVLRAIISDVNNASKTSSPVTNDLQILALLKKRKFSSQTAAEEAKNEKREDLAEKQQQEIEVIDDYTGTVKLMPEDEIRLVLKDVVEKLKSATPDLKAGQVLKEIFKPGGAFEGKAVEKSQVAKAVGDLLK